MVIVGGGGHGLVAAYHLAKEHGTRNLAVLEKDCLESVEKIDTLFAIEREINGLSPQQRAAARDQRSRPLVEGLHAFLRERRAKLSGKSETAKAIDYSLKRWEVFTRFLDDGWLCMSNNAAERELRAVAVGRKNWTFAGSDEVGRRAAAIYTLIQTAKLNGIDPQVWLADVLTRLSDHPASKIPNCFHGIGNALTSPLQPDRSGQAAT